MVQLDDGMALAFAVARDVEQRNDADYCHRGKTGRRVTTPVQYLRDGDDLWVTSTRQRTWWRNLRGGAQMTVCLRGKDMNGYGEAIELAQAVADGFRKYSHNVPQSAR